MVMMSITVPLQTEHFQFYIQDKDTKTDTSRIWNEHTEAIRVAVANGLIAVATERFGGITTIELVFEKAAPRYSREIWNHIVHCSIELNSGCFILHSPELKDEYAPLVRIPAGVYEFMIFFGNTNSVEDEMEMQGDDLYRCVFWSGAVVHPLIIKQMGGNQNV